MDNLYQWVDGARRIADTIYKQILPYFDAERVQRELQDINLEMVERESDHRVPVSEKFRTSNYDDMLLEFYDSRKIDRKGWALYSQAEVIAYFVPSNERWGLDCEVYMVDNKYIKTICESLMNTYAHEIAEAKKHDRYSKLIAPGIRLVTATLDGMKTCSFAIGWYQLKCRGVDFKTYTGSDEIDKHLKG